MGSHGGVSTMLLAVLIGIMIAIVVGVTMIPAIIDSIKVVQKESPEVAGEGTAMGGLLGVLPIVLVAVILLGAVAWMGNIFGGFGGRSRTRDEEEGEEGEAFSFSEFVRGRLPTGSSLKGAVLANFERLQVSPKAMNREVGIKPVVSDLFDQGESPLMLNKTKLGISSRFSWYPVEKHPKYPFYKVVGLHKWQSRFNCVYLLGKDTTIKLVRLPQEYITKPMVECVSWSIGEGKLAVEYRV